MDKEIQSFQFIFIGQQYINNYLGHLLVIKA